MIICAGRNEIFDFALPMGVGLVETSINLTVFLQKRAMVSGCVSDRYVAGLGTRTASKLTDELTNLEVSDEINLDKFSRFFSSQPTGKQAISVSKNPNKILNALPDEIIFIGSGGLYKEGEILEIYESFTAGNVEISSLENKSYTPLECEISSINFSNVPRETIKINSSNYITTDQNLAQKLFEKGYFLENMEFFAVLKTAQKFQIPARGVFVATNFCDQNAHADFVKNHNAAKEKLTQYLKTKGVI